VVEEKRFRERVQVRISEQAKSKRYHCTQRDLDIIELYLTRTKKVLLSSDKGIVNTGIATFSMHTHTHNIQSDLI
jgi:hypothetical protein